MELFEAMATRQSCRNYDPQKPVEIEKLRRCMEAARIAPSACNSQPWSFIVINDKEMSPKVAAEVQAGGGNKFCANVPAFIVVTEEPAMLIGRTEPNQKYAHGDVGMAVENICLAATAQGLSTCIMGSFSVEGIKNLLDIPAEKTVRLVLAVGYAAAEDNLRPKKRMELEEFVRFIG